MNKNLNDWLEEGWLVKHRLDRRETREILGIADCDIIDAQAKEISTDTRLSLSYNAALQLAIAALAAVGYRASHEAHHYRAVQSFGYDVQPQPDWQVQS
jgi:hypothetical protein